MVQLQKPKFVYTGGKLRPWDEAVLHVGCEAVTRGLNVFEGIKGYWQPDSRFGIVMLRHHYERLRRSARLLHIPCDWTYEEYQSAIFELIGALVEPDRDMWARTTLYVIEGYWGEGTVADLVVTAYYQDKQLPQPIHLAVSTWRRSSDVALPARIKTSTNYQAGRLARIEGRPRGCQDMVMLNEWRAQLSTGSCVLMVREGTVYTPPATEGSTGKHYPGSDRSARSFVGDSLRTTANRPQPELLVADEDWPLRDSGGAHSGEIDRKAESLSEESPILRLLQAPLH